MRRRRRCSGFTLIEMTIATGVLAVISIALANVTELAATSLDTNAAIIEAQTRVQRAANKVQRLFRGASLATVTTIPAGFETPQAVADDVVMDNLSFGAYSFDPEIAELIPEPSAACTLTLQDSTTDPVNGMDDDHDGVVDGRDVMLSLPDGTEQEIVRGVNLFQVTRSGRSLTFTVAATVRTPEGQLHERRGSTTINLRND